MSQSESPGAAQREEHTEWIIDLSGQLVEVLRHEDDLRREESLRHPLSGTVVSSSKQRGMVWTRHIA